jgi:cytochrome c peroxidase
MRANLSAVAWAITASFLGVLACARPGQHDSSAGSTPTASAAAASTLLAAAPPAPAGRSGAVESATQLRGRARARFGALAAPEGIVPATAALGRRLFFEKRMSADGQVGCVSCHLPERWGADGLPLSRGVFGHENPRNAPTVFNAGLQSAQHWRADRASLDEQASRALLGPASFGLASDAEATQRLQAMPEYEADFEAAFPGDPHPVSVNHWGAALAAYESTLVTPAPFDAWLEGSASALDADATLGLALFLDTGCGRCHDGPLLGGQKLRKFGATKNYWERTHSASIDTGRFDVTHDEKDRGVFKVSGLRNVARTAPYFHDGSVASLSEAVTIMAELQLDRVLAAEDTAKIVAFLESLTGPVPPTFSPAPDAIR